MGSSLEAVEVVSVELTVMELVVVSKRLEKMTRRLW